MKTTKTQALELMHKRVPVMFTYNEHGRMELINEPDGRQAPMFYLARTGGGNLWRFHADLPDDVVDALERCCRDEPHGTSKYPVHEKAYLRILADHDPVQNVSAGPAFAFPEELPVDLVSVEIGPANADLLNAELNEWLPDAWSRHPFRGVLVKGKAVSVCASVRTGSEVHEAGVETAPGYRRQGYAVSAVNGWAQAVRRLGAIPLYSTSWDNIASRQVAENLLLTLYGADFHIT